MTISQEKSTLTNNNTVSCGNLTCHNICKVTLTENKTLKHSNHLICSYLYRDSTIARAHHDCKYHAIPSLHRDCSLPKVPGQVPGASSGNAYSLNCRAVIVHSGLRFSLRHFNFGSIFEWDKLRRWSSIQFNRSRETIA